MPSDWYVLAVNPEPWRIGPAGVARKSGKLIPYVGRDQQLAAYKAAVAESIQPIRFFEGKVELEFFFWRHRATYETQQARTHRKHEADITNMQKATEDALQGILFKNDKDTNHVESHIVAQGPNVTGKIVIRIDENPDPRIDLPEHIWALVNALDEQPATDPNAWGPECH